MQNNAEKKEVIEEALPSETELPLPPTEPSSAIQTYVETAEIEQSTEEPSQALPDETKNDSNRKSNSRTERRT